LGFHDVGNLNYKFIIEIRFSVLVSLKTETETPKETVVRNNNKQEVAFGLQATSKPTKCSRFFV
jgi:hypothetical protein